MINIPKGTKDVLPQESYKWQYAENKAREVCRLFNCTLFSNKDPALNPYLFIIPAYLFLIGRLPNL